MFHRVRRLALVAAVLAASLFVTPAPRAYAANGCGNIEAVNTGAIVFNMQTMVNANPGYADIALDPTQWKPTCLSFTATGIDFYAQVTCGLTSSSGSGPNYRMAIGLFEDGVHHGEVNAFYTPENAGYYETIQAGSLLERSGSAFYGVHTFDLRVWGIQGAAAFQECNLNVLSFPVVT